MHIWRDRLQPIDAASLVVLISHEANCRLLPAKINQRLEDTWPRPHPQPTLPILNVCAIDDGMLGEMNEMKKEEKKYGFNQLYQTPTTRRRLTCLWFSVSSRSRASMQRRVSRKAWRWARSDR